MAVDEAGHQGFPGQVDRTRGRALVFHRGRLGADEDDPAVLDSHRLGIGRLVPRHRQDGSALENGVCSGFVVDVAHRWSLVEGCSFRIRSFILTLLRRIMEYCRM